MMKRSETGYVSTYRKQALALALAAMLAIIPIDWLQNFIDMKPWLRNIIGLTTYIAAAAIVLKAVSPLTSKNASRWRFVPSLFFSFGALFICTLFNHYWLLVVRTVDANGEVLGKVVEGMSASEAPFLYGLSLILIGPFCEEIIFRLGFFEYLGHFIPKWFVLILSSALFACGHWFVYDQVQIAQTFVFGLMAGIVYLYAGLVYSILLHIMMNSWADAVVPLRGNHPVLGTIYTLMFAGLVVFLFRVVRLRKTAFGN